MEVDVLTKKKRNATLRIVRAYIAQKLSKYKDNKDDFRTLSLICDLNPPRIAEAHHDKSMNESTLKKLLQGGFVTVAELQKVKGLDTEGIKYLRTMLGSDKKMADAGQKAFEAGYSYDEIVAAVAALSAKPKSKAKK